MEWKQFEDLQTFLNEVTFAEEEIKIEDAETGVSIQNVSPENLSIIYKNIPLTTLELFAYEVEIGLLSNPENSGYGLLLGWDGQFTETSMDNCLRILLDPMGKFSVDYFFEQKSEVLGVEESSFISQGNAINKIKVEKVQDDVHFLVNDNEIFTVQQVTLTGTAFGIILGPLTNILVSSLSFVGQDTGVAGAGEEVEESAPEEPEPEIITEQQMQTNTQYYDPGRRSKSGFRKFMIVLLLILWGVGIFRFRMPGYIHILLIVAVILMVIPGRRRY